MVSQGRVPYHEHDDTDVRDALAQALGERKVRLTDRRLLILYGLFIAMLLGLSFVVQKANHDRVVFQEQVIANCRLNQANTVGFNHFVDKIVKSYSNSPVLTPKQQQQRAKFFEAAKQQVPVCPPEKNK